MKNFLCLGSMLVLPLALLLFGQWPLREWIHAFSREANDAAQVLFALYSSLAISAATRAGTHLTAGRVQLRSALTWRAWAVLLCVGPWAAFVVWTATPQAWNALIGFERFPETFNPGYFLIRLAAWLLPLLALLDAINQVARQP